MIYVTVSDKQITNYSNVFCFQTKLFYESEIM